jgi:pimeloyl-ACP methyl ester carboxylesterase
MVTRTHKETIGPGHSIPDASAPYTAEDHWVQGIHWVYCHATQPRLDAPIVGLLPGACHAGPIWTIGPNNWVSHLTRAGYDVFYLSLPGHGASEGDVRTQTNEQYLQAMLAVALAVAQATNHPLSRQVWIAHSMGGVLAQLFLARHPDLAGIVVVDSPAVHRTLAEYQRFFVRYALRHPWVALQTSLKGTGVLFGTAERVRNLLVGPNASDALVDALRKYLGDETALAVAEMRKMGKEPLTLPGERVLYIAAERSAFFPWTVTQASAEEYGASFTRVPGAHNVMMTEGALPAVQAIEAFLARLPARASQHTAEDAQPC